MGLGVLAVDQLSKAWVRSSFPIGNDTMVVPGWVWFSFRRNTGAAFGLFSGHSLLIAILALIIVVALIVLALSAGAGGLTGALALGAVAGGALGNLVDRFRLGAVTDFIEIHRFPTVFNLADVAIRLGVVIFLLSLGLEFFRGRRRPAT